MATVKSSLKCITVQEEKKKFRNSNKKKPTASEKIPKANDVIKGFCMRGWRRQTRILSPKIESECLFYFLSCADILALDFAFVLPKKIYLKMVCFYSYTLPLKCDFIRLVLNRWMICPVLLWVGNAQSISKWIFGPRQFFLLPSRCN